MPSTNSADGLSSDISTIQISNSINYLPTTPVSTSGTSTTTPEPLFSSTQVSLQSTFIDKTITATITTEPPTTSTKRSEDDDYLDLGEVLKVASPSGGRRKRGVDGNNGAARSAQLSKKKRTKFRSQVRNDNNKINKRAQDVASDISPDEDVISITEAQSDVISRRAEPQQQRQQQQQQNNRQQVYRPGGAFLSPIQDPYGKLGRHWSPPSVAPLSKYPNSASNEDEEEEPLEGRLEPGPRTTTRKPVGNRFHGGVARPIPGTTRTRQRGGRVQLASTNSPQSLNDDTNDDLEDPPLVLGPGNMQPSVVVDPFASPATGVGRPQGQDASRSSPSSSSRESEGNFQEPTTSFDGGSSVLDQTPSGSSGGTTPMSMSSIDGSQLSSSTTSLDSSQTSKQDQPQGKSSLAPAQTGGDGGPSSSSNFEDANFAQTFTQSSCTPFAESATEPGFMIEPGNGSSPVSKLTKSAGFNASEVNYQDCIHIPEFKAPEILGLNDTLKDKLKSLCWETMFGQEMVKIVVMDLVMTVVSAVSFEFMRACFVRYCNRFFFWDLERGFPGYQDFKIAENVLHLVNNQSTVWMGMFFAPGLPALNTVKLAILMYVRSWAVLTCNIPHETVFKVSKSNNFYYWILLINLLICILPVAYAVTWIRPSWHCGPFGGECRMYLVMTKLIRQLLPPEANNVFKYLTSPGAVIPILIALILIIYYLASTVSSSKEANKELKAQLKKDKEQEAAVPEITNTTVTDTTSNAGAPSAGPIAGVLPAAPIGSMPLAATLPPVKTDGNSLVPSLATAAASSVASPSTLSPQAPMERQESRPKSSLLMPPAL